MFAILISLPSRRRLCQAGLGEGEGDAGGKGEKELRRREERQTQQGRGRCGGTKEWGGKEGTGRGRWTG